jgi:perosamine synthetase
MKVPPSSIERIPVAGPWISQREIDYVTDAVTNAWYGNANMYHARFEKAFREYVARDFAMALPSCTSAIHLALLALGVGPGDEVVIPDCTWIASAAPISYVGATPVFVDMDESSWCIRPDALLAAIGPLTKAVIVVDLYGSMPDMTALLAVAREHGIAVIEDSAEAIGSEYKGSRAGSFGDVSVFSFHGSKTLTTGEGGMLVTNREDIYTRAQFLRDHGRTPGDVQFFNTEVAYKYKMSSMQAALGLAQLERIDELIARKREIFSWYSEILGDRTELVLNSESPDTRNSYWMVTTVWDRSLRKEKNAVVNCMRDLGVDVRPFFHPLSSLPAYAANASDGGSRERNPVSYDVSARAINLPSGLSLTRDQAIRASVSLLTVLGISQ